MTKTPTITLLGSNSGNNVGDAAILSSILESLTKRVPNLRILVPTTKPSFTDLNYGMRYNVKGVDMMPWTASIRFVGLPTFLCLARSEAALICDGIIFGKKLWNPFFNWLIMLIFLVPVAKLFGCKLVCYSCGIGPFPSTISEKFARWVINSCDLVMMRENDSVELARKIGVTVPMELTGDAAFINPVSSDDRAKEVLHTEGVPAGRPLFGINVTQYMDAWLKDSEKITDKSVFISMLAQGIKGAQTKVGFEPVVFSTHPMDDAAADTLARLLSARVIKNSKYLSHDMQAVMRRCSLFMGMRFHSVILASAVGVPIVGLIYAPKVRGYMRLLKCERYSLELSKLSASSLTEHILSAWNEKDDLANRQKQIIDTLKEGAERAADTVASRYYPETAVIQGRQAAS